MKKSLTVGIVSLFILSALAPMSLGYDVKNSNEKELQLTKNRRIFWIEVSSSPQILPYSVGTVGVDKYIFLANSGFTGPDLLMRYDIYNFEWKEIPNPPGSLYWFKNSVAMTWDRDSYIYVLFGGSYSDCQNQEYHRFYYRRFKIPNGPWETLKSTPWYQGPGNAITWIRIGNYEYIYALLGTSSCSGAPWGYPGPPYHDGVQFWRYNVSNNIWDKKLTSIPYGADDGSDLLWTGGDYIYAFSGAYNEDLLPDEERHFLRYSISFDYWIELSNTPYQNDGGVDDGGSLIYPGFGNQIYAIKGGDDPGGSSPGDDFWCYNISSNKWIILPNLPAGIGNQNGHRLAYIDGNIYCWRGCYGNGTLWSYNLSNNPPNTPDIDGPNHGKPGEELCWTFHTTDPDGDDIKYIIDWGDGSNEETDCYPSCTLVTVCHNWSKRGKYQIRVKAQECLNGLVSPEATLELTIPRTRTWLRFFDMFPFLQRILDIIL